MVIGHRGARGLLPENTLPAIQKAIELHVDMIDMDVAMTADGVLVVAHDLVLNPDITRDVAGNWIDPTTPIILKHLSFAQLQRYNVGKIKPDTAYARLFPAQQPLAQHHSIPTLKEALDLIKRAAPKTMLIQIELKSDPTKPDYSVPVEVLVTALNRLIIEEGMSDRIKVQAFDWRCLQVLQHINSQIETAYLTDEDTEQTMLDPDPDIAGRWSAGLLLKNYHNSLPEMIKALGGRWWDAQDTELTTERIEQAHKLGLLVAVWLWPERNNAKMDKEQVRQFEKMHVDAIITDRPDLIRH